MESLLFYITTVIFIFTIIKNYHSNDKSKIWSPIVFFCLYNIYYVVLPGFTGGRNGSILKNDLDPATIYLYAGAIINFIGFIIGFKHFSLRKKLFTNFNNYFDKNNSKRIAIILFTISFVAYGSFKGFSLNIFHDGDDIFEKGSSLNHADAYFVGLISVFGMCYCLLRTSKSKLIIPLILISMVLYIIGGFRFRIAIFLVIVGTFYHLYPSVRKINYKLFVPIFMVFYIGMGVIEMSRSYGHGLNYDVVTSLNKKDYQSARENEAVSFYTAKVMQTYDDLDKIYFESLWTAICMPIPRFIYPSKPEAQYLIDSQIKVLGVVNGAASLEYAESFLCFGWLGVFINGLFYGILGGLFWKNFKRHPDSIGAIILLASFNGVLYMMISRGYLAQIFHTFIYYVFVPFWLVALICKINPTLKAQNKKI